MSNPETEDGYTQIANEILEALCWMNLSPYEGRVLWCVIRKTYGWKKKIDWISLSQFSDTTGLDRRHIYKALKRLLFKRIIVISRDDKKHPTYGFQKDYEKWEMSSIQMTKLARRVKEKKIEERRRKKSISTDDSVSSLQIPTKEIFTKETLKKEEEREAHTPFFSSKEETQTLNQKEDPRPYFLQRQIEELRQGKGALRYIKTRKKSAERQKNELTAYCKKEGIPFSPEESS